MNSSNVLVTGGAGFIGSNLVGLLLNTGNKVTVLDNLSSGHIANIERWLHNPNFTFIQDDCVNLDELRFIQSVDTIFHLAANPDVKIGFTNTRIDIENNILATYNLLETVRKSQWKGTLIFTSSSTVYGEPWIIPTPETYGPLQPISVYGASKLACESLISAYSNLFEFTSIIYRFANVVGKNSNHGVIYDFFNKLQTNNTKLEILGDGNQTKSYLYIDDCINALLSDFNLEEKVTTLNVGSEDQISVSQIAKIVAEKMGCKPEFAFNGGVDGGRGWNGDVKEMLLDVSKLKSKGWRCRYNSTDAVIMTVRDLKNSKIFCNAGNYYANI